VIKEISGECEIVLQEEQLGTAHALLQAEPLLKEFSGSILVLSGDTPLIQSVTIRKLVDKHLLTGAAVTVLTARVSDPTGYGRVVRNEEGLVDKIIEHKDASEAEKQIDEINTGIYCFDHKGLFAALKEITPANAQGEYYLTDVIGLFAEKGRLVSAMTIEDPLETSGINDRVQLAEADRYMRMKIIENMMKSGVTVIDPSTTFVDRKARVGRDTVIHPFTILEGNTQIGEDCILGPGTRLVNTTIGNGVTIQNSIALDSRVDDNCQIGPFAYLRPETNLGKGVKIGDFVEIKKSTVGDGSKIPHMSYIGDAEIGQKVNIGAGTITCNYDGSKKWPTLIGDGAFIGSNTNLVAPVEVGVKAVVGAGSTISKDVPDGALGVGRAKQKNIKDWADNKRSP
jgi:bifunctional UDP-N-acetylglucosamine pyrophosphorylase/glucosamine-1-phosphate N-acetyltransferase